MQFYIYKLLEIFDNEIIDIYLNHLFLQNAGLLCETIYEFTMDKIGPRTYNNTLELFTLIPLLVL